MKYKNLFILVFVFICLFFLTSCSSQASSQVVLQENLSDSISEGITDREDAVPTALGGQTELTEIETQSEVCYVYICGAVYKPGVYELPVGSRLYEAVEAAGGFLPDACADYWNLASVVSDGMQYRIPTTEEILSGNFITASQTESVVTNDGNVSSYDGEGRLDINLASVTELMTLPGIGQTRADAIVTYREEHGRFSNKEEIMQVTGIKEGLYSKIEDYITVRNN